MKKFAILALPLLALAQPVLAGQDAPAQDATMAIDAGAVDVPSQGETENLLMEHIRILASDDYMGRKPGTEGGRMTVAYQIGKLKEYGYEPGWNGSFEQEVPFTAAMAPKLAITAAGSEIAGDDLLSLSGDTDFANAELMAIENADDVDESVDGKLLVFTDFALARSVARDAVGEGARGAIILAPAAMIEQFRPGTMRERVRLKQDGEETGGANYIIMGPDAAERLKAALGGELSGAISGTYTATGREFTSSNVIAKLPGSRPEAGAIVMLAHWDHTGECGAPGDEDRICNGAVDNASGVAAMLETARRLAEGPQLERDVYIFGTTAEEMGLLGARYFADNPPVPLENIHAALNLDTVSIGPKGMPLSVVGLNRTPLDASIKGVAASLGRTVDTSDAAIEVSERFIRRQDGWALMNSGVPTVLIGSGVGDSEPFETYMATRYHRANDEIWDGFEIGGVANDVPVYVALMQHWATEALYSKPAGWAFEDGTGE
jgi:hypothetical protein